MMISMIVAMDLDRGIGYLGKIPWHLPSDLRRFKQLTMGHHIIMGRKTFESIGKILPGRISVVLSRHSETPQDGFLGATSIQDALAFAEQGYETEAFVIGGAEVFSQTLSIVDRIYLTTVQAKFLCDVRFPELDEGIWKVVCQEDIPKSERDPYASIFQVWERIFT